MSKSKIKTLTVKSEYIKLPSPPTLCKMENLTSFEIVKNEGGHLLRLYFKDGVSWKSSIPNATISFDENRSDEACIVWSVEDFKSEADELTDRGYGNFDETKFEDALHKMIRYHDAHIGITWDTVKDYLLEYCKA